MGQDRAGFYGYEWFENDVFAEPAYVAMTRGMPLGIKRRAEAPSPDRHRPAGQGAADWPA